MTARGAGLLAQAGLASLGQASGIDLESYRQAHVSACVARALARHRRGGILMLGRCEQLLSPGPLGLAPAGPHLYRKVAA